MSDWQDISTAPKDGTRVDLWFVDQDGKGWREPDRYWGNNGWFSGNSAPTAREKWIEDEAEDDNNGKIYAVRVTHWMPRPKDPRS